MYVLDTDTYSNFLRGHEKIKRRVLGTPPADIYICAITPEEMLKGRMAAINEARGKKSPLISPAYDYLIDLIKEISKARILKYDAEAEKLFQSWPDSYRKNVQDARIAAVACVNNFKVVTCNVRHFEKIAEVQHEDWSV